MLYVTYLYNENEKKTINKTNIILRIQVLILICIFNSFRKIVLIMNTEY